MFNFHKQQWVEDTRGDNWCAFLNTDGIVYCVIFLGRGGVVVGSSRVLEDA